MAATISNLDLDTLTVPTFKLQAEQFGLGSCGPNTLAVFKSDFTSCEAFLTLSGNSIVL